LVFLIISCKFLLFVIIDFNKTYISQMYNVNNLFLTTCAMRTCMFLKSIIGCKVLWKSIKMVENTWSIISYHWIFGLSNFRFFGKLNQSRTIYFYCWKFNQVFKMLTWNSKLKNICINLQELSKWSMLWLWKICRG
jgi:hypothetical protein